MQVKTVETGQDETCLIAREAKGGQAVPRAMELVFTFAGVLAIFDGLVIAYFAISPGSAQLMGGSIMPAAGLVALGLAFYAFGSRGFCRQVKVDLKENKIAFGRVNSNNVGRIKTEFSLDEIESLYVKRSEDEAGKAGLMLRKSGRHAPYVLLEGAAAELAPLHEGICDMIGRSAKVQVKRPVRHRTSSRTPLPV
ncbi:hypothetical protein RXV86_02915 [Alisedimentitalea sp. MJ-SS2]|uniref:hypothetical protein n=1 Tax=Aliisedimentitalea sp. MJ-SS2 TaxID=3049795 RepID=UPI00290B4DEA|nr:hypothetical protein [Alisedimentitalea sp. MJ-SS2]MDU8926326.1 hypothetical protein [Alisedimentitalea sp. MJ-SS2]